MPPIKIVNLIDRLDSNEVRSVFLASGYPAEIAEDQADSSIALYKEHPEWKIFGAEIDGKPIGMIGVELMAANEAEIRGIAVIETFRNHKIGTKLIQYVWITD